MTGSVRKRGNRWYYSFELARVDGKRQRVERVGGRTKKEAEAALRKALNEYLGTGQHIDESTLSVSDYFNYWYDNYVEINLKYNTKICYRGLIDNHIVPALGKYTLKSITPAILQKLLNDKKQSGYSKNYLSGINGVLSKGFSMAVYPYQFIKMDPMRYVSMPKYDEVVNSEDLKIITIDEFKRIVERFPYGSTFYMHLQIAFNTGMRAAEVSGLTWDCVDLENKTIRVEKILIVKKGGVYEFGSPKTKSSYRTITISDSLVSILKRHLRSQKENKLKYGKYYTDENFVCTREDGTVVGVDTLKYLSRVVNNNLGIDFNFHGLRHTHASMLLEAGVNIKVIQARLGHSNLATTMDTYAHITEKLEEQSRNVLNSLSASVE